MKSQSIAQKNDAFRLAMAGCRIVLTAGVAHSPDKDAIIQAARSFNNFTEANDPYGEHDFAFFEVNGSKCFFKFDYYDDSYEFYQEDGNRLLTIGFAEDY